MTDHPSHHEPESAEALREIVRSLLGRSRNAESEQEMRQLVDQIIQVCSTSTQNPVRTGKEPVNVRDIAAGVRIAPETTETIEELADLIPRTRDQYLDAIGSPDEALKRLALVNLFMDDKGGFALWLRELVDRRRLSLAQAAARRDQRINDSDKGYAADVLDDLVHPYEETDKALDILTQWARKIRVEATISASPEQGQPLRQIDDHMTRARRLVEDHISAYGMVPHPDKIKEAIAVQSQKSFDLGFRAAGGSL